MYVCLCEGVTDQEVREAIERGACSVAEVMACSGAGLRCGSCRPTLATLLSGTSAELAADAQREAAVPAAPRRRLEMVVSASQHGADANDSRVSSAA
jgi:bacterioferritin-associated ferredoxin